MSRKHQRTSHTCRNCGDPFTVKRNQANRNADIRYCDRCKTVWSQSEYRANKSGVPKRISKFSRSGKVSILAD